MVSLSVPLCRDGWMEDLRCLILFFVRRRKHSFRFFIHENLEYLPPTLHDAGKIKTTTKPYFCRRYLFADRKLNGAILAS